MKNFALTTLAVVTLTIVANSSAQAQSRSPRLSNPFNDYTNTNRSVRPYGPVYTPTLFGSPTNAPRSNGYGSISPLYPNTNASSSCRDGHCSGSHGVAQASHSHDHSAHDHAAHDHSHAHTNGHCRDGHCKTGPCRNGNCSTTGYGSVLPPRPTYVPKASTFGNSPPYRKTPTFGNGSTYRNPGRNTEPFFSSY